MVTIPKRETSLRFRAILEVIDKMTEDWIIYLCFHAPNEVFDQEMEMYGIKMVRKG